MSIKVRLSNEFDVMSVDTCQLCGKDISKGFKAGRTVFVICAYCFEACSSFKDAVELFRDMRDEDKSGLNVEAGGGGPAAFDVDAIREIEDTIQKTQINFRVPLDLLASIDKQIDGKKYLTRGQFFINAAMDLIDRQRMVQQRDQ